MASQDIDMPLILAPARGCGWAILLPSGLYFCGLGDRFLFTCPPRGVAERRETPAGRADGGESGEGETGRRVSSA